MKLGEILVKEGLLSDEYLKKALEKQKAEPDKKLGEILLDMGFLSVEQLVRIVRNLD